MKRNKYKRYHITMGISNYQLLNKTAINSTNNDIYIEDIVIFECDNLSNIGISGDKINVFRSASQKNDMPSIFTLGVMDERLNDALSVIKESGDGVCKDYSNVVYSDHLTIISSGKISLFITFLGGSKHLISTRIYLDDKGNFKKLSIVAPINKLLKPNESFTTEDVEMFLSDDVNGSIIEFAKKKNKNNHLSLKKRPSVYCTWYYYGQTITMDDCIKNIDIIKEKNLPLDTFQLDDGWEDYIGDWNPNSKFNNDLSQISNYISSKKLTPGIWTSPFILDKKSQLYKNHKDWILKDKNGKPCIFSMNKKNYYIIDITIKETWEYFYKLYQTLTDVYGFKYHKLDFTRAPVTTKNPDYANKYITIVEAYKKACEYIRKGMGNSFFLMCGGLYDPLIGVVDAQRSGSDVLSMWMANQTGGKTLPFTIKQSLLRYYMNYWWYNDPDALVIRKNKKRYQKLKVSLGLLNDEEVKTSCLAQLTSQGLFCITEPLDLIDDSRLLNWFRLLPKKDIKIEIVSLMESKRFPHMIRVKYDKNKYALVITNYDDNDNLVKEITKKDILGKDIPKKKYLYDYYKKHYEIDKITINLRPHSSTIIKVYDNVVDIKENINYLD